MRWYDSHAELPPLVKLVPFALGKSGLPEQYCAAFEAQPCACISVAAADYHWVHAPCPNPNPSPSPSPNPNPSPSPSPNPNPNQVLGGGLARTPELYDGLQARARGQD